MAVTQEDSHVLYIARAIGIILVVFGHYMWHPNWTWSPYLFHMPLFFVLGGMVCRPIVDFRQWIVNIGRGYILYYVFSYLLIAVITWLIISNWDTRIVFYLGDGFESLATPILHNSHNNSLFMVGWFIVAYCLSNVLFRLFLTFAHKYISPGLILFLGVSLGYVGITYLSPLFQLHRFWLWNIFCQVSVGLMYFTIGYVCKQMIQRAASLWVLIISWGALWTLVKLGLSHELGMSWSEYPDGFVLHLLVSMFGVIGVLSLANTLRHCSGHRHFVWLGKQSKSIMTYHMVCLVLVDLLMVELGYLDSNYISALHHYVDPVWGWIYIGVGVYGAIGINHLVNQFKSGVFSQRRNSTQSRLRLD
ncbi:acyltransferase family protein [Vibrio astriarenae]|uniref:acyltransferase family protein n=1 Tax=Vibrio astriarenae TaxID=1481923 RepID=UPI003734EF70